MKYLWKLIVTSAFFYSHGLFLFFRLKKLIVFMTPLTLLFSLRHSLSLWVWITSGSEGRVRPSAILNLAIMTLPAGLPFEKRLAVISPWFLCVMQEIKQHGFLMFFIYWCLEMKGRKTDAPNCWQTVHSIIPPNSDFLSSWPSTSPRPPPLSTLHHVVCRPLTLSFLYIFLYFHTQTIA